MRFWPPLQLLAVGLILGAALISLVSMSRDRPAPGIAASPEPDAMPETRPPLPAFIEIVSTAPLERLVLIGPGGQLHLREGRFSQAEAEVLIEPEPDGRVALAIDAHFLGAPSEAALRLTVEPEGMETIERVFWAGNGKPVRETLTLLRGE